MAGHIGIVQIGFAVPPGEDGDDFFVTGRGARLASMYGELLGMQRIHIGYHKLVHEDGRTPEIGFEYAPDDPPPQWPHPDHPQQVHLDIEVGDLDTAEQLVLSHGATRLHDAGDHRVLADPASHPFCLYRRDGADGGRGRMARIVFDCFSPRALAAFYEELLDMRARILDTPERVEIACGDDDRDGGGGGGVVLAFQHSVCQAPRWPDPAYPAQLHLDIAFDDESGRDLAERLGAMRRLLPDRPDHLVYADPAGHPFCLGIGGWGAYGPAQVAEYEAWMARQQLIELAAIEDRRHGGGVAGRERP